MSTLKASCGCEMHVAQWTAKRKIGSVKQCPLHKNALELLEACKRAAQELPILDRHQDSQRCRAALQVINEAIAKAEGAA